ncbi:MAG: hypothetical protein MMC33_000960 [Icmadophila ericetorum]|nr:hypothetical protein [Icmadophila ericetorum]
MSLYGETMVKLGQARTWEEHKRARKFDGGFWLQANIHRWWDYFKDLERFRTLCNAIHQLDVDIFDIFWTIFVTIASTLSRGLAWSTAILFKATPRELEGILTDTNVPQNVPEPPFDRDQLTIMARATGQKRESDRWPGMYWE